MFFEKFAAINNEKPSDLLAPDFRYAKLILPANQGKITVTSTYNPNIWGDKEFCTLDQNLESQPCTDYSYFYYGASPKLNSSLIMNAISNLELTTVEKLNEFIASHSNYFMLHTGHEDYLLPMAKHIVLAISYNYGIVLRFTDSIPAEIRKEAASNPVFLEIKVEEPTLTIRGCPTKELLDILSSYRYVHLKDNLFEVTSDFHEGIDIGSVYCEQSNIDLLDGSTFYSGVLPKALRLEERNIHYNNSEMASLCIYYERSTYATVFAMDNDFTSHPLLTAIDKKKIREFFNNDDDLKRAYLTKDVTEGKDGRANFIEKVNSYLQKSSNVNQIGVSGNIITSDNRLICAVRSQKVEEGGKIFPSVNGHAEIADMDVEYYKDSVDVDRPTMHIDQDTNSFATELCREAEAELNLSLSNNMWKCYGIVLVGNIPDEPAYEANGSSPKATPKKHSLKSLHKKKQNTTKESKKPAKRRMHLNILYTQKIDKSLKEVKKLQANSMERFENNNLIGVTVRVYQNFWDLLGKGTLKVIRLISDQRTLVTQIVLIISAILASFSKWEDWIKFPFAILMILFTVIDWTVSSIDFFKRKKTDYFLMIVNPHKELDKQIAIILSLSAKKKVYHPVAYIAFKLHQLEVVDEALKKKQEKKQRKEQKKFKKKRFKNF